MMRDSSRPQRTTIPVENESWMIQITDDGSRTLIDPVTQTAFHSASGAAAETQHVYLRNSGVTQRLDAGLETRVLEIGLGTGLGLLLTLDAAMKTHATVDYYAVESEWLSADVLRQLNLGDFLADPSIAERFVDWRASIHHAAIGGTYHWSPHEGIHVAVCHVDALDWPQQSAGQFHAIYFDPFAPDVNPELWNADFLSRMRDLLTVDGRLVTYCVNRRVREQFELAGFDVQRVRGPLGGKREVLIATTRTKN